MKKKCSTNKKKSLQIPQRGREVKQVIDIDELLTEAIEPHNYLKKNEENKFKCKFEERIKKREEQEGFDKREFTYCRDILSQKKKENLAIEPYSAPMSCSSLNKNQVRSEAFDTIQLLNVMLKAENSKQIKKYSSLKKNLLNSQQQNKNQIESKKVKFREMLKKHKKHFGLEKFFQYMKQNEIQQLPLTQIKKMDTSQTLNQESYSPQSYQNDYSRDKGIYNKEYSMKQLQKHAKKENEILEKTILNQIQKGQELENDIKYKNLSHNGRTFIFSEKNSKTLKLAQSTYSKLNFN